MKHNSNKYLLYQVYITTFYIINVVIGIILLYNEYLNKEYGYGILDDDIALTIAKINKIIILIVFITFLYFSYKLYSDSKNKFNATLQIYASSLTVIVALIALYIVYNSDVPTIPGVVNPAF